MPETSSHALAYDALTRQLERMRAMQYAYFAKFFTWIILTGISFVVLYLVPYPAAQELLPFWVITAGVQASFYLHFVDFARVHAQALEAKINQLLGEEYLLGAQLENIYFYPIDQPKISGVSLTHPTGFFSVYTLHWLGLWSFFFLFGTLQAVRAETIYLPFYLCLLASWLILNTGFLAWYFIRRKDLRRVTERLQRLGHSHDSQNF